MMESRTDWTREEIAELFDLPFDELMWEAQAVHRRHHARGEVQLCTLLSIKTGGCAEDCGYCSQSAHADTGLKATKLMDVRTVLQAAAEAKDAGSQRFCMGAAWRNPKDRDMPAIVEIVQGVSAMGMETCMTLGMLTPGQAAQLKAAGLDYYNHNIDTAPENYANVITTRSFEDRLDTLENVRSAGINVCCGGIVGMGETRPDRVGFLHALATMPHPESVPINALVPVKGTVLGDMLADTPLARIDDIEFVRTVAVAGLDYYNHNIDTSPENYGNIISTRTFQDRLDTLDEVRSAGINVCSGGIVGMGETRGDRVGFIHALATLPEHPGSVPINALIPIKGTVLGDMLADTPLAEIDDIEFVRTVAVARITMPLSMVRLSAGRESMSEATQALCFMAGANSIFTGDKLLTTGNRGDSADAALFAKLGLKPMVSEEPMRQGCLTEAAE
jgi:biotin synthase